MPNEHRVDPTPPPHHGQGLGGSKKESSSLRASPALHPPERPSPRRADIADHGLGRETRERRIYIYTLIDCTNIYTTYHEGNIYVVPHRLVDNPERTETRRSPGQ